MSDTIRKKRGRPRKKVLPVKTKDIKRGEKQCLEVDASEIDPLWRRVR